MGQQPSSFESSRELGKTGNMSVRRSEGFDTIPGSVTTASARSTMAAVSPPPLARSHTRDSGRSERTSFGDRYRPGYSQERSPEFLRRRDSDIDSLRRTSISRDTKIRNEGMAADFDYSKVPKGPKGGRRGLEPVPDTARRVPHIFISREGVPVLGSTIGHLTKRLKRYQPFDVKIDDSGYYVSFPDTISGRTALQECYRQFNMQKSWDYTMLMTPFKDGSPPTESPFARRVRQATPTSPQPAARREASMVPSVPSVPSAGQESSDYEPLELDDPARSSPAVETSSNETRDELVKFTGQGSQAVFPSHNERRTSPGNAELPYHRSNWLESPSSRQIRHSSRTGDDNLSVQSWRTGSDRSSTGTSRSTSARCYICKKPSALDTNPLVNCGTCKRRYHRGCHNPVVPVSPGLPPDPAWQCYRCTRKARVEPRTIPAPAPVAPQASTPNNENPERPTKRQKLGSTVSTEAIPQTKTRTAEVPESPSGLDVTHDDMMLDASEVLQALQATDRGQPVKSIERDSATPVKNHASNCSQCGKRILAGVSPAADIQALCLKCRRPSIAEEPRRSSASSIPETPDPNVSVLSEMAPVEPRYQGVVDVNMEDSASPVVERRPRQKVINRKSSAIDSAPKKTQPDVLAVNNSDHDEPELVENSASPVVGRLQNTTFDKRSHVIDSEPKQTFAGASTINGVDHDEPEVVEDGPSALPKPQPSTPSKPSEPSASMSTPGSSSKRSVRSSRPNYTNSELAGMALSDAPGHRSPANEICKWIADHIPGYDFADKTSKWQSHISATLSAGSKGNRPLFEKQDRREDDPAGKGNFWALRRGEEHRIKPYSSSKPDAEAATNSERSVTSKKFRNQIIKLLEAHRPEYESFTDEDLEMIKAVLPIEHVEFEPSRSRFNTEWPGIHEFISWCQNDGHFRIEDAIDSFSDVKPVSIQHMISMHHIFYELSLLNSYEYKELPAGTLGNDLRDFRELGKRWQDFHLDQAKRRNEAIQSHQAKQSNQVKQQKEVNQQKEANHQKQVKQQNQTSHPGVMKTPISAQTIRDHTGDVENPSTVVTVEDRESAKAPEDASAKIRRIPSNIAVGLVNEEYAQGSPSEATYRRPQYRSDGLTTLTELSNARQTITALESHSFSVNSFFDQYPQYRPESIAAQYRTQYEAGVSTKMSNTRKRPNKKKVFGITQAPRTGKRKGKEDARDASNARQGSTSRSHTANSEQPPPTQLDSDADLSQPSAFGSLEELLGLPENLVPAIHDHQSVFRDDIRDANGELKRTKNYYRIGHNAK